MGRYMTDFFTLVGLHYTKLKGSETIPSIQTIYFDVDRQKKKKLCVRILFKYLVSDVLYIT